jgi:hypothetical protein
MKFSLISSRFVLSLFCFNFAESTFASAEVMAGSCTYAEEIPRAEFFEDWGWEPLEEGGIEKFRTDKWKVIEPCFMDELNADERQEELLVRFSAWPGRKYFYEPYDEKRKTHEVLSYLASLGSPSAVEFMLQQALGGDASAFSWAKNRYRDNPHAKLELYREALANGAPSTVLDEGELKTLEKCTSLPSIDIDLFLEKYGIEPKRDSSEMLWEIAETASNTSRFGEPSDKLALQLICSSEYGYSFSKRAFNGAVADLWARVQAGSGAGFNICSYVTGGYGQAYCARRREEAHASKLAELNVSSFGGLRIEDPRFGNWENPKTGEPVPESCLAEEWLSSDNFDAYEDHYGLDDFRSHPGRHLGNSVPLAPFWYEKYSMEVPSIAQRLTDCKIEHADGYQVHVLWRDASEICTNMVPHLDACYSMAYVQKSTRYGPKFNIYALVTHGGVDFAVLVTNGQTLEQLISKGMFSSRTGVPGGL